MVLVKHDTIKSSPHFNEIHKRLINGESPYSVNKWMVKSFNKEEVISVSTLRRYKNDLSIEEKVAIKMDEIIAKENEVVNEKATKEIQANNETEAVIEQTAENMMGVFEVANYLPKAFKKAKLEADDPEHRTSQKDIVELSLKANRLINDFFKTNDSAVNVNINNGLSEMFDETDIMRFINESQTNEPSSQ